MTDAHDDEGLRALLTEAVSEIRPDDRLGDIRAAVRPHGRPTRSRPTWLHVTSGVVATAAVIGAVAYATGALTGTDAAGPGPARPGPSSSSTPTSAPWLDRYAVYYVGDSPDGRPVLFREFHSGVAPDLAARALDDLSTLAQDPDYSSVWPVGSFAGASLHSDQIDVDLADPSAHDRPIGMSPALAEASVQQVIYTVQAAYGKQLPVRFTLHGHPVDRVLGVPTSEPVVQGDPLTTLSLMSISSPDNGARVSGKLTVTGENNGFEASLSVHLERAGKSYLVTPAMSGGWTGHRLYPWSVTLDLGQVLPGRYTLVATNDDPSGKGLAAVDTRTIIVK